MTTGWDVDAYNKDLQPSILLASQGSLRLVTSVPGGGTHGWSHLKSLNLSSANEIAHGECDWPVVVSCNFGWFQPHVARVVTCHVWDAEGNIRMHTTIELVVWLGGRAVVQEFPWPLPVFKLGLIYGYRRGELSRVETYWRASTDVQARTCKHALLSDLRQVHTLYVSAVHSAVSTNMAMRWIRVHD